MRFESWFAAAGLLILATSCGGDEKPSLTRDQLLDPETCMDCHPNHYREWQSSMHAYASEDPVFIAMNARGQRETGGDLGDFCVKCHAPMAVREGFTTDGLNLADAPAPLRGVTCFFCHSVESVEGTHDNPLTLATDNVLRGGIENPVDNGGHLAAYSALHDGDTLESASLCGSCHDIVNSAGVHLERTYAEWQESLFATDDPVRRQTCNQCHMHGRDAPAADDPDARVPVRRVHEHLMPGIDVATTPHPNVEAQSLAIQCELQPTILATLCVTPRYEFELTLETINVGHSWPSGAAQDRRAWVEFVAYEGETVLWTSGQVADDEAVAESTDVNLWLFRDTLLNGAGDEVHMFWEAEDVESNLLPVASSPTSAHTVNRTYSFGGGIPDRATVQVHIRPLGREVLDSLVDSGDLDPAIRDAMPTFTLEGASLEWTTDDGFDCVTRSTGEFLTCPRDYQCSLDPSGPDCGG